MIVCVMKNEKSLPQSMLEVGELPRSPAYEMRNGKLLIKFEPEVPSVRIGKETFSITDAPCVVVGGKKLPVSLIV